ncbi:MAG: hypothetical protein GEU79_12050 [Acidimicrobiia bacterium]|nr:hypothetical protein [Acidimicrobiia bacterium]
MHGYSAENVELVSYHDLDSKPCFKLALQVVEDRWFLYATRFWESGISIIDVTDPATPKLVGSIPGPDDPNVATWQVQVADGLLVAGVQHRAEPWGGDPSQATDEGIHLWDVTDPESPSLVSKYRYGAGGTHRNLYTGGQHIHATASVPGMDGYIYSILDIEDRSEPQEIGRWFLPEQYRAAGGPPPIRQPSLHGPAYPVGDRCYLPYGQGGMVILDISQPGDPQLVSRLDFGEAFSSKIALHTVVPLPSRDLAVVNTEAIAELSEEPYNFAGIVDISDETAPRLISLLPPPVPHHDAGYPNFQKRGGRYGPHNQHLPDPNNQYLYFSEEIVYLTWFNAGLRVYDISNPYLPREIGSFLPDDPEERRGLLPRTALVTQSEDVLVDSRGYAYLTDKNHGLHIVRYTG